MRSEKSPPDSSGQAIITADETDKILLTQVIIYAINLEKMEKLYSNC